MMLVIVVGMFLVLEKIGSPFSVPHFPISFNWPPSIIIIIKEWGSRQLELQ